MPNSAMNSITEVGKKIRVLGILISILMVIFGIAAISRPVALTAVIAWMFVVGVAAQGVHSIVKYFQTPAESRQSWMLVSGILSLVLGVITVLITGLAAKIYILSFTLCFMLLNSGIGQFTQAGAMKREGVSGGGWCIFSGIIDIICAFFFMGHPFIMTFAYEYIMGIYLVVSGVLLLIECLFAKKKDKGGEETAA